MSNADGHLGGGLVGVAVGTLLADRALIRAGLAGVVGLVGFAVGTYRAIGILAVVFAAAAALWWLRRAWQLTPHRLWPRPTHPTAGRPPQ